MAAAAKPLEGQRCMHWLCKDLVAPDLSKLNKRDQTNTDDVWNCVNSPTRSVCCSQIWLLQSSASSIYASLLHLFVFFLPRCLLEWQWVCKEYQIQHMLPYQSLFQARSTRCIFHQKASNFDYSSILIEFMNIQGDPQSLEGQLMTTPIRNLCS